MTPSVVQIPDDGAKSWAVAEKKNLLLISFLRISSHLPTYAHTFTHTHPDSVTLPFSLPHTLLPGHTHQFPDNFLTLGVRLLGDTFGLGDLRSVTLETGNIEADISLVL